MAKKKNTFSLPKTLGLSFVSLIIGLILGLILSVSYALISVQTDEIDNKLYRTCSLRYSFYDNRNKYNYWFHMAYNIYIKRLFS